MTEPEKREKAIKEMTNIIFEHDEGYVFPLQLAILYDHYILRKEEEIRKETAIEYSNKIDEIVDWCISNKIGDDFDYEYFSNCLRNLKKEYGVEVAE